MIDAADLDMYALYIGIFISPIQILVELIEMMQKGLAGFRRYLDVIETEPDIEDAPDAVPLVRYAYPIHPARMRNPAPAQQQDTIPRRECL